MNRMNGRKYLYSSPHSFHLIFIRSTCAGEGHTMRSRDRHTLLARPLVGLHISHTPFLVQNRHSPLGSGHFNHLLLNSVVCLYRGKVTGNQGSSSKYRGFHGFPVFKNHVELAKELWDSYSLPNISQLLGTKGLDFSSEATLGPRRARARPRAVLAPDDCFWQL